MTANSLTEPRAAMRQALARRLLEVERALKSLAVCPTHCQQPVEAADPEETLRRSMVKYWPRVASSRASAQDIEQYLALLFAFEAQANDATDLRFFDAWNQAYEALTASPPPVTLAALHRQFLDKYFHCLQTRLSRLQEPCRDSAIKAA